MGWGTKFFSHALAAGLCLVFQANQSQAQDSFDLNAGILPVSPLVVQDQEKNRYPVPGIGLATDTES